MGVPPGKIDYIANGVDIREIDAERKAVGKHAGFTLGYVGRLVKGKRLEEVLHVFDRLWQAHPESRLLIVAPPACPHPLPHRIDVRRLHSHLLVSPREVASHTGGNP